MNKGWLACRERIRRGSKEEKAEGLAEACRFLSEALSEGVGALKVNEAAGVVVSAALSGNVEWLKTVVSRVKEIRSTEPSEFIPNVLSSGWLGLLSAVQTKNPSPLKRERLLEIAQEFPVEVWKQDTVKATVKTGAWSVVEWLNEAHPEVFSRWHLSKKGMVNQLHADRLYAWQKEHPESVGFLSAVTMRWNQLGQDDVLRWTKEKYKLSESDWLWLNEGWEIASPTTPGSEKANWKSVFERRALTEKHVTTTDGSITPSRSAL